MHKAIFAICVLWISSALAQSPPLVQFKVDKFTVEGENPLDPATTDSILNPFLGDYSGIDGLLAAGDALERELIARGNTFMRVTLPPQDLVGGVVTLKIVTFTMGQVAVHGNTQSSEAAVRRSMPGLKAGEAPDMRELSRELAVANQHPSKRLRLNFAASETAQDTLDADLQVQERKPWNVFAGINNIGTKETGYTRLTFGGQYANVTGHDDIFTGSYTLSPDNADNVSQFGAFYQIPIYALKGWLSGFYVRSDVDVGNVQNFFDVSGSGVFVGISFRRQLMGVGRYRHGFTVGIQDRAFDTGIFNAASGTFISGISSQVRSRPISLRYDGGYSWTHTSFDFYVDFNQNLTFGGHNNKVDYAKVRAPTDPAWKLLRFGATVSQDLPRGWTGVGRLNGQYTNEPLIPGEEFGLGGERSIRGFDERTVAGDKGVVVNLELWSPPVVQLYGAQFLGFIDAGYKRLEEPLAKQRPDDTLSSGGVGVRWRWRDQLQFALDYGHPIAHAAGEASDKGTSKWHVSLQCRY